MDILSRSKILQIEKPIIYCYPHHANLKIDRVDFNFGIDIPNFIKNYPHVNLYKYKRAVIRQQWGSYSNFVKCMINNDCYVHFLIDLFYISAYKGQYGNNHDSHNITVN